MTSAPPGNEVISFGCRLNAYESAAMRGLASEAGLTDAVIVNTCAVTAEAERQARQAIRKARRQRPGATIIVTGCAAQIAPEKFAAMPEVDRVLGNTEKLRAADLNPSLAQPRVAVGDIMAVRETAGHLLPAQVGDGFEDRARAFLQVQQGCDHRCTFCIIPYGRGNSRSDPVGSVVEQARGFVAQGFNELVLTGVDLTAYGADLPGKPGLGQLVRRLLALVPDLKRLRLSSLDPVEIDEDLWRLIAEEERLMPHLHLSAQAGDDMVLKRMKRRHLRQDMIRMVERARALRPDVVFGADLIAGFPTETEAMFQNTLALVEDCGLTFLHVFPFSPREGTPAARMPAVHPSETRDRARRLRQAGEAALRRHVARRAGSLDSVLVERDGQARARDYTPVRLAPGLGMAGQVLDVMLVAEGDALVGHPNERLAA
ncbi:MAG: tRNA (N(6)-L-threonylcarbamoyladenosine(37)-C(2))-methylthiotransferase MtaB [Rhodospirillales bacterium]|nr:tRNA (N(6)-L-threonylcarbamoyladenosine(37)-C(2))-methylthiotransferase MtaB [Rhodospirillales bacterium]